MSELDPTTGTESKTAATPSGPSGAGRMLRQAREAQGMSIDMLATSMKVTVRKLEMLEAERFDELPDATFARALAQAICRTLKIDAGPVLAQLPPASGHRIEVVSEGLNAPFRDHPSRLDPLAWAAVLRSVWAPALVLGLAALLYFLPGSFFQSTVTAVSDLVASIRSGGNSSSADKPAVETIILPPSDILAQSGISVVGAASSPPAAEAASASVESAPAVVAVAPSPAPATPGLLELRANAESWIEVKDGRDRILLSRSLKPNESVMLDGVMPIRVKIGNAAATELRYRGELIDLAPMTSENIARVQLK